MPKIFNPYLDEFRSISENQDYLLHWTERKRLVQKYSWAIPNDKAIETLVKYAPIVEIGAGTGYWAFLAKQHGIEYHAYDRYPVEIGNNHYHRETSGTFSHVEKGGPEKVKLHPNCTLFLCWPPYEDPMAYRALRLYQGEHVIYVGEYHGCTANEKFHDYLQAHFVEIDEIPLPKWEGIHDSMMIFKRA